MTTFGESCIIGMLLGEFKGILLCIFAVEAYTASWIEIYICNSAWNEDTVEAYTASWIEMYQSSNIMRKSWSRLIQPRGLKCLSRSEDCCSLSRGLYSLVD